MNKLFVLGPKGSVSSFVAERFKDDFKIIYCKTFAEIFRSAAKARGWALAPVRNKIIGSVKVTESQLNSGLWRLEKKIRVSVRFVMATKDKIRLDSVQRIYGPPQAVNQCHYFLSRHFKGVPITYTRSTGSAFKHVASLKRIKGAAIGAAGGAQLHGLHAIVYDIQDDHDDWTEFSLVEYVG